MSSGSFTCLVGFSNTSPSSTAFRGCLNDPLLVDCLGAALTLLPLIRSEAKLYAGIDAGNRVPKILLLLSLNSYDSMAPHGCSTMGAFRLPVLSLGSRAGDHERAGYRAQTSVKIGKKAPR